MIDFRIANVIESGDKYVFGRYIDKMYKFSKKPGFEGNVNVYLFNEKEYQELKEKYGKSRFELKEVVDSFEFYKFQNIKVNKKNYVLFTVKRAYNKTNWFLITEKEFQKLKNVNYDTTNKIELETVCCGLHLTDLEISDIINLGISSFDVLNKNGIELPMLKWKEDKRTLTFHFLLNKETQKVRFLVSNCHIDSITNTNAARLGLGDFLGSCLVCVKYADSNKHNEFHPSETSNFQLRQPFQIHILRNFIW